MAQKAATRRRRCSTAAFCVSFATSHLHKPPLPRHAPPFTSYTAAISASLEVIGGNLLERGRGPFEVCDFMPDLAVFFGPRSHQVGNVTIVMSNTCRSMQILKCFVLCVHAHYVMITNVLPSCRLFWSQIASSWQCDHRHEQHLSFHADPEMLCALRACSLCHDHVCYFGARLQTPL